MYHLRKAHLLFGASRNLTALQHCRLHLNMTVPRALVWPGTLQPISDFVWPRETRHRSTIFVVVPRHRTPCHPGRGGALDAGRRQTFVNQFDNGILREAGLHEFLTRSLELLGASHHPCARFSRLGTVTVHLPLRTVLYMISRAGLKKLP